MSNISAIIDVFNMQGGVTSETKARLIIKLGRAINNEYGSNLTEELVYELVSIIDPDNPITKDPHYLQFVEQKDSSKGSKSNNKDNDEV